jgi:Arc/MetJ-type ribon-helix-helix transcriptional regulator
MGTQRLRTISVRVTETLAEIIDEYLRRDAHVTPSDFVRDAIREKLKRDTPELYNSMFTTEAPQILKEVKR